MQLICDTFRLVFSLFHSDLFTLKSTSKTSISVFVRERVTECIGHLAFFVYHEIT